ncbi:MAG: UDP-N-acetylmuramoyl-L-alanine--D-glutamate ligase [Lachnospiraceae bacterium]|nr:UDP-N-acetylmuramoyl-L-alanine--D-glutamate ligase [Lachnospiraceae bacterium]
MNNTVLVLGAGGSGIHASDLALREGKSVVLYDGNTNLDPEEIQKKISGPVRIVLGELPEEILREEEFAVISPGIPTDIPLVTGIRKAGLKVLSEIEFAWLFERGTVIGITGTNGKTTTVTLVGDIMKAAFGEAGAFTVGNIGTPYTEKVSETTERSVTTVELSSFQLETVDTFHPHVSAILNITPDHLNRHHTMEAYAEAKERVTENQDADDTVVLNWEDERLRAFGEHLQGPKVLWFSGLHELKDGYYLKGDTLYAAGDGVNTALLRTDEVHLVGRCNYENILAAIAVSDAMNVPRETTLQVVKEFRAVSHRIEFTRTVNGVRYYDDSKGTNPDAAIQGIRAMNSKTVLIGGGYDKGSEFDDWIKEFGDKVKLLILMGTTAQKIADTAKKYGFTDVVFVSSMEEAVQKAYKAAIPGENVLLSPACASWDMFKSYEQRGDIFKKLVRELPGE